MSNTEEWIRLSAALGPASRTMRPLLDRFGTPEAIFAASDEVLALAAPYLTPVQKTALRSPALAATAADLLARCRREGVTVLTFEDAAYPAALRAIAAPPAVLYCRGTLPDLSAGNAVGVVGTRRPDAYGELVTYNFSFALAAAGLVTVSGMAEGVDGLAAAATLAAGGVHVAVLGCGIDRAYPRHHAKLYDEIAAHGALLSEYAPGTPPNSWQFPQRNRIISALSAMLLVTEAPVASGALITARYAAAEGKTVFAIPADVYRAAGAGCNELLRAGAFAALTPTDVLGRFSHLPQLREPPREVVFDPAVPAFYGVRCTRAETVRETASARKTPPPAETPKNVPAPDLSALDPRQRELYALLPDAPFTADHLEGKGFAAGEIAAALTVFEIYGLVGTMPGGRYCKITS